MSLLDYFKSNRKNSANVAKERLQIIVSHERSRRAGHESKDINLQLLQQKLIDVISEFLHIDEKDFKVEIERDDDRAVFELNVTLPDKDVVTTQ